MNIKREVERVLEGFMGGSSPDNPLVPDSQKRKVVPPEPRTSETTMSQEDLEDIGLTTLDSDETSLESIPENPTHTGTLEDIAQDAKDPKDLIAQIGNAIIHKLAKIRR
jgi:hypothetical protein